MRNRSPFVIVLACSLAACVQSAEAPSTETAAVAELDLSAETKDKAIAATYLIRPGMSVPDGADLSRDDVPRDPDGRPYTHKNLGERLPAFAGETADGGAFTSTELEGKWTVIEIWGLWCHDSMNDAPYAAALSTALAQDPSVSFMSIHTPQKAERADDAYASYGSVAAYFDDKGYSFTTVVDTDASIREALNIRWTPTYLLVAPDLSVQAFRTGLSDAEGEPVKDFVRQISQIRGTWQTSD